MMKKINHINLVPHMISLEFLKDLRKSPFFLNTYLRKYNIVTGEGVRGMIFCNSSAFYFNV